MTIQAVTGLALMTLLFLSALMESSLVHETADRFFFDKFATTTHEQMLVSDEDGLETTAESPVASLPAKNGEAL